MKKIKLSALALVLLFAAASSFTVKTVGDPLYWFNTSDIYQSAHEDSDARISDLQSSYPGQTLNIDPSDPNAGTLVERGWTELGAGNTHAGTNEESIYVH